MEGTDACEPSGESDKLKQGGGDTPGPIKSAHGRNSDTPASTSASGGASGGASDATSDATSDTTSTGASGCMEWMDGGTGRLTRLTVGTNLNTPAAASGLTVDADPAPPPAPPTSGSPVPVQETALDGVQCTVAGLLALTATVA